MVDIIHCDANSSPYFYQRLHPARPVNTNSLAFLVTGNVSNLFALSPLFTILVVLISNPFLICLLGSAFAVYDFELSSDVTKLSGILTGI